MFILGFLGIFIFLWGGICFLWGCMDGLKLFMVDNRVVEFLLGIIFIEEGFLFSGIMFGGNFRVGFFDFIGFLIIFGLGFIICSGLILYGGEFGCGIGFIGFIFIIFGDMRMFFCIIFCLFGFGIIFGGIFFIVGFMGFFMLFFMLFIIMLFIFFIGGFLGFIEENFGFVDFFRCIICCGGIFFIWCFFENGDIFFGFIIWFWGLEKYCILEVGIFELKLFIGDVNFCMKLRLGGFWGIFGWLVGGWVGRYCIVLGVFDWIWTLVFFMVLLVCMLGDLGRLFCWFWVIIILLFIWIEVCCCCILFMFFCFMLGLFIMVWFCDMDTDEGGMLGCFGFEVDIDIFICFMFICCIFIWGFG